MTSRSHGHHTRKEDSYWSRYDDHSRPHRRRTRSRSTSVDRRDGKYRNRYQGKSEDRSGRDDRQHRSRQTTSERGFAHTSREREAWEHHNLARNTARNADPFKDEGRALEIDDKPVVMKELPNFEVSGVLAEDQNQINGVPLIFALSVDAASPDSDWRLYEFLGDDTKRSIKLDKVPCFLLGSDSRLSQVESKTEMSFIPLDHESCSKQHAVIQFRNRGESIKPYIMDLGSSNKTSLNGEVIEPGRYIELRHQDVVVFGKSHSEFVLLNASLT